MKGGDFVKLKGLSKQSLNGRLGIVHNKNHTTDRYTIGLVGGSVVSIKAENLELTQEPSSFDLAKDLFARKKTEFGEKGFKDFAKDSLRDVISVLTNLLPAGLEPKFVFGGFGILFIASFLTLGFLKALLLTYTLFSMFVVMFPVYKSSGGGVPGLQSGVTALVGRTKQMIQQVLGTRYRITDTQTKVALVLHMTFITYVIFFTGSSGRSQVDSYDFYKETSEMKLKLSDAFTKGFQSSEASRDLDEALAEFLRSSEEKVEIEAFDSEMVVPEGNSGGIFSVTRIAPLVVVGKLVYDIGKESSWNPQLAMSLFNQKPIWQKIMVVFVIARIFM